MPQQKPHILFVDDNTEIASTYESIVTFWGYNVVAETSPLLALQHIKANPDQFDLVIADFDMPEMRGDSLLRKVIRIRPEIPTILITGHSEEIHEEQTREQGISILLTKPVLPGTLADAIEVLLKKKH